MNVPVPPLLSDVGGEHCAAGPLCHRRVVLLLEPCARCTVELVAGGTRRDVVVGPSDPIIQNGSHVLQGIGIGRIVGEVSQVVGVLLDIV